MNDNMNSINHALLFSNALYSFLTTATLVQKMTMEIIVRKCQQYKSSNSSQLLREIEQLIRHSGFQDQYPDFLEQICNTEDVCARFAAYDILVLFCKNLDITKCLTVNCLTRIIQEINYTKLQHLFIYYMQILSLCNLCSILCI